MQSALEFIPLTLIFLIGHLLMVPIIAVAANRVKTTEVKPWGELGPAAAISF